MALYWLFWALGLGFSGSAHSDVWGYVDTKGVAHFAVEKIDARYELYYKGGQSFDTRDGLVLSAEALAAKEAQDMPRNVAVPKNASKLIAFFDVSPNYKAVKHHLREASRAHNIDMELLQALIATESGFDTQVVSPKGAVGLMQLMPPTAKRYGVQGDASNPIEKKLTDPRTNIRAGSQYLRDLMNLFPGKLDLVLAAYNAGEGAVQRNGNQVPPYKETQNYVKTVTQIYELLKPPPSIQHKHQQARLADSQPPTRVRMQIGGHVGGATGRGNMVPPLASAPAANTPALLGDVKN